MIRERVKAGMLTAKHKGIRCGRPRAEVDRRRVLSLRGSGLSIRAIAEQLGIGKGTVERLLMAETGVPKR
jgi:DNA invertase Pin-like site-specific DNA recombinase